ncbi:MAG: decaprenyl-phosphate phosphoribosyltransferase [Patescibacteria group bacterium]|nr:decaprenyl-phosphate phosphoribosyltransferase [Patescibacteria group bacterium]MCL5431782.1 decaprenyl-phosphate phosphoribosyltransferase [Patescibacteria group bacterium]
MAQTFFYLLKEIRVRQWLKNVTVFAAIFFTGQLLNPQLFIISILAFLAFCAASSVVYLINDLTDIERDRLHPFKKNRPLASGKISKKLAVVTLVLLLVLSFLIANQINFAFVMMILAFYALHISYSLYLKNIILIDIIAIAAGFILRVFAGEVATGYHLDIWMFLTVVSGALFLAIGKRRSELTLLSGWNGALPAKTRATLSRYSEKMLDVYISMFANSTWITYAFYTFLQRPPVLRKTINILFDQYNLDLWQDRKYLTLTIPFVIYAVMRYLQLIYEKNEGESPEKILLSDKPLMITCVLIALMLFTIIYIIGKY